MKALEQIARAVAVLGAGTLGVLGLMLLAGLVRLLWLIGDAKAVELRRQKRLEEKRKGARR